MRVSSRVTSQFIMWRLSLLIRAHCGTLMAVTLCVEREIGSQELLFLANLKQGSFDLDSKSHNCLLSGMIREYERSHRAATLDFEEENILNARPLQCMLLSSCCEFTSLYISWGWRKRGHPEWVSFLTHHPPSELGWSSHPLSCFLMASLCFPVSIRFSPTHGQCHNPVKTMTEIKKLSLPSFPPFHSSHR